MTSLSKRCYEMKRWRGAVFEGVRPSEARQTREPFGDGSGRHMVVSHVGGRYYFSVESRFKKLTVLASSSSYLYVIYLGRVRLKALRS